MNENQLAYPTLRAIEPASIAGLLNSEMFAEFNGRILITGFSDLDDLLNSNEASGVLSAIDTIRGFLSTLFNANDVIPALLEEDSRLPSPSIQLEFKKTLYNSEGKLIFDTPGFQLPTAWIHRAHGGYDQRGRIGVSIGLDPEPMVPTIVVSRAISCCKGRMLLAVLPLCTSAPSSEILRNNPRILMVEGNDIGVVSESESEDRMRSLHQLQERTNRLLGWYPQVLQHTLGEDWFSKGGVEVVAQ